MKKVLILAVVAVLSMGILTACGGGGGAVHKIEVLAGDGGTMQYTPATLEVKKGEKVEVTLINKDAAQAHSFVSTDLNVKGKQVQPGQKEVLTFTASKDTDFWCDVPGHKDGGMLGHIKIVQ